MSLNRIRYLNLRFMIRWSLFSIKLKTEILHLGAITGSENALKTTEAFVDGILNSMKARETKILLPEVNIVILFCNLVNEDQEFIQIFFKLNQWCL